VHQRQLSTFSPDFFLLFFAHAEIFSTFFLDVFIIIIFQKKIFHRKKNIWRSRPRNFFILFYSKARECSHRKKMRTVSYAAILLRMVPWWCTFFLVNPCTAPPPNIYAPCLGDTFFINFFSYVQVSRTRNPIISREIFSTRKIMKNLRQNYVKKTVLRPITGAGFFDRKIIYKTFFLVHRYIYIFSALCSRNPPQMGWYKIWDHLENWHDLGWKRGKWLEDKNWLFF